MLEKQCPIFKYWHHKVVLVTQYSYSVLLAGRSSGRLGDLMLALQVLLDKLNSGNLPMSKDMWEQLQSGVVKGPGVGAAVVSTNS